MMARAGYGPHMPSALRSTPDPAPEAGAAFAVDRLVARKGTLIVEGRWSGVRGMRFLRPTLVVDGRQVLATLEHKPWAPAEGSRARRVAPARGRVRRRARDGSAG